MEIQVIMRRKQRGKVSDYYGVKRATEKGKPPERLGRKAKGLTPVEGHDSLAAEVASQTTAVA